MTHAVNDNVQWQKKKLQRKLPISIDHTTRTNAYTDEKEPKWRKRKRERESPKGKRKEAERQEKLKLERKENKQIN